MEVSSSASPNNSSSSSDSRSRSPNCATDIEAQDLNDSLPKLCPVRRQPTPSTPQVGDPPEPAQISDNETTLKQIHTRNIQDNLDLTC